MKKSIFTFLGSVLLLARAFGGTDPAPSTCIAKFVNPITEICWACGFPVSYMGIPIGAGMSADNTTSIGGTCQCIDEYIYLGIIIGSWSPSHVIEVPRKAGCSPAMGFDMNLSAGVNNGTHNTAEPHNQRFYQVHVLQTLWTSTLHMLVSAGCEPGGGIDVLWITEFDPTWNNERLSLLQSLDAFLYSSLPLQLICIGDCIASTAYWGIDLLHWCMGCQGPTYPFIGQVEGHMGGIAASFHLTERMIAKLHRDGIFKDYSAGPGSSRSSNLCSGGVAAPIFTKSNYKIQLVRPFAMTGIAIGPYSCCQAPGAATTLWESGKEFPVGGEDFAYQIFRKGDCCYGL